MNAQQSNYLPSVHHVMSHVTRDSFNENFNESLIIFHFNFMIRNYHDNAD